MFARNTVCAAYCRSDIKVVHIRTHTKKYLIDTVFDNLFPLRHMSLVSQSSTQMMYICPIILHIF